MLKRPDFLQVHADTISNARTLVREFQGLQKEEADKVDRWLLIARQSGSMTSAETYLYDWINDRGDFQ